MIFEYIVNIIFWVIFGNPFLNFIDLCATSNISVLILSSPTTGFYIHGRSIHAHADDEMSKLHEQLTNEAKDNVGLRGLVQNTNDQVFHIYLSQNFGLSSKAMYEAIRQRYSKKAIAIAKAQNIRSKIEVEAMAAYNGLNQYFRRFFEASESEHKYIIQKESMMEKILDWGPQVNEETILTISGDYSYRKSLMCGIEWTLCAMCLLLFAGIEMETQSPTIAAFMTFIVDQILVRFFRYRAKRNLAEKAILDKKFLIS
ncbi:meckelin isoform X5 [Histomonas meleagridis]|uniref:meckelin isoform X5 n=1 Tax=Histomonas meleagridis TaxID=135588 RepID=UPI003559C05C|nr:meckelin isoform X5 [Histomonas meleagridis]KAH0807057.1 meckelin isoform X5 [Histomonas meleagridis]